MLHTKTWPARIGLLMLSALLVAGLATAAFAEGGEAAPAAQPEGDPATTQDEGQPAGGEGEAAAPEPAVTYRRRAGDGDTYTVTYDGDVYGSYSHTALQGETYTVQDPADIGIARVGYSFDYWYERGNAENQLQPGDSFPLTGDLTLVAVWAYDGETYTVTYDGGGYGSYGSYSHTAPQGETYTVQDPADIGIARAGHSLDYWYERGNAENRLQPGDSFPLTGDLTLVAWWAHDGETFYYVTYDPGEGRSTGGCVSPGVVPGEYHVVYTQGMAGVARPGFRFRGWSFARDGIVTHMPGDLFGVHADETLYAVWEYDGATLFAVSYHPNGGDGTHTDGGLAHRADYTVKDPGDLGFGRTGYTFAGWNTEPDGTGDAYAPGGATEVVDFLDLYAMWAPDRHTVTYHPNGGAGSYTDAVFYDDQYPVLPLSETGIARTGYVLSGWNTRADGLGETYDPAQGDRLTVAGDVDLYAMWAHARHTVTYHPSGGAGSYTDEVFYDDHYPVRPLSETGIARTGYVLTGWNTRPDGLGETYDPAQGDRLTVAGDVDLYAMWAHDETTYYRITYDPGEGRSTGGGAGPDVVPGDVDLVLAPDDPRIAVSRRGYVPDGWQTEEGAEYKPGASVALQADLTLYARWQYDGHTTFAVTYDAGGGEGGHRVEGLRPGSHTALDPAAAGIARYGYSFTGWWTEADGGSLCSPGGPVEVADDLTLYAGWAYDFDYIDLGLLGGTDADGGAGDTAWRYDASARMLTLRGAGPYALTGANDNLAVRAEVTATILMDGAHITAPAGGGSALHLTGGGLVAATGDSLLRGAGNAGGSGGAALSSGSALHIDLSGGGSARMRSAALFASAGQNSLQLRGGSGAEGGMGIEAPGQSVAVDAGAGDVVVTGSGAAPGVRSGSLSLDSAGGGAVYIEGGDGAQTSRLDVAGDVTLRGTSGHALYDGSGSGTGVTVRGGTLSLEAEKSGIASTSSLSIGGGGSLVVASGGDGIVSDGSTGGVDIDIGGDLVIDADGHGIVSEGSVTFYQAPATFTYTTTSAGGCAVNLTGGNSGDLVFAGDSGALGGIISANRPGSVTYGTASGVHERRRPGSGSTPALVPTPAVSTIRWIISTEMDSLLSAARTGNLHYLRARGSNPTGIRPEAMHKADGYRFDFDSLSGGGVSVRVSIPEPSAVTGDLMLTAYVGGAPGTLGTFERYYTNSFRVVRFEQKDPWGQTVTVAAKVDLTGMDVGDLALYSYDPGTNRYARIADPGCRVDPNGYLWFSTPLAGDILISDGPLARK